MTQKKEGTVVWPAMFFEPPEKLRPPKKKVQLSGQLCFSNHPKKLQPKKKRYSHLTNGWNKSQITICRVKIRTHQLRLEKLWPEKKETKITVCRVKIRTPPITLKFEKIFIGFLYFTETMRSKLSVSVYFFLALFDCTFFSGHNFFRSYVSTKFGARVKIRTPITTQKITTQKKSTVIWLAMFFEPPGKLRPKK